MDEFAAYTVTPCAPPWPRGEAHIHATGCDLAAVVRSEPWPEVLTRPWPDGVRGLPIIPWLCGHKRTTAQSRTAVRLLDGRPVLWLHERQPIFQQTAGIFDSNDVRIGYCRGAFKGGGDTVAVMNLTHDLVGKVVQLEESSYQLVTGDGVPLGDIKVVTGADRKTYTVAAISERPNSRLFVLAIVLVMIAWGRQASR